MPKGTRIVPWSALVAMLAAPLAAYQPHIPLDVRATDRPDTFEVFEQRGAGPSHIWCVAADHARRNLGAQSNQRIYVASPLGPSQTEPGRTAVGFTLSADQAGLEAGQAGAATLLGYTSIRTTGASMNLTQALQFCTDHMDVP
ncbi:MAG: hypothetical protein ACNA7O_13940 [Rhodobacterales bacterium]